MIDLHTHTTHSDGTFTPEQLVRLALDGGFKALAITDHDTVDGVQGAIDAVGNQKLKIVAGVELSISADLPGNGHLHLLGLFVDPENKLLLDKLDYLRSKRIDRIYAILEKLNDLDLELSTDDLNLEGAQISIGRPHIARIMVNHGYVKSIYEAFNLYLNKGQPAYVAKEIFDLEGVIEIIHNAGGLAIMAHPVSLGFEDYSQFTEYISDLLSRGMDGIEAYSSFHSPEFTEFLLHFARKKNICISGGSDFHGANKPEIALGRGLGKLNIPENIYKNLLNKIRNNH